MKLVVTGGGDYINTSMVYAVLTSLNPTDIYVGDFHGSDELTRNWADENKRNLNIFVTMNGPDGKPDWKAMNREMLDYALEEDPKTPGSIMVLAFPGGKGTEDCVKAALERSMIVLRVEA